MLFGTILLGLSALLLYSGFTGNSAIGEIQKLLAGEPAFGRGDSTLTERITGGGVRTGPIPIVKDDDRKDQDRKDRDVKGAE